METSDKIIVHREFKDANDLFSEIIIPKTTPFAIPFSNVLYRGQSSSKYSLLPTALRISNVDNLLRDAGTTVITNTRNNLIDNRISDSFLQFRIELEALKKFFKKSDMRGLDVPHLHLIREDFIDESPIESSYIWTKNTKSIVWLPLELRELAGLAQHYGIQTRLLDWSYDAFVALYFAASGALREYESGKIDTSDYMVLWILDLVALGFDKPSSLHGMPLSIIQPTYKGNPNLAAQSGAFTLWEENYNDTYESSMSFLLNTSVNRQPLDELITEYPRRQNGMTLLYKYTIPVTECFNILNTLTRLNYDASKIFPGYDGVVKAMHESHVIKSFTSFKTI